jgi:hypothetical protein
MSVAAQYDITMDQGTSYVLEGYVQTLTYPTLPYNESTNPYIPFNFAGWAALMEVRDTIAGNIVRLTSTDANRIQLNYPAIGYFTFTMAPSDTFPWAGFNSTSPDQYNGVYDITMSQAPNTIKPYTGAFNINRLISY